MEPLGAVLHTCQFQVGDATLSTLELWGAEYQESNALLCRAEDVPRLLRVGRRERCPVAVVGRVTGDGRVVLCETADESGPHPVDLPLQQVLGQSRVSSADVEKKVAARRSIWPRCYSTFLELWSSIELRSKWEFFLGDQRLVPLNEKRSKSKELFDGEQVLKDMPPKNFELQSHQVNHAPLDLHGVDVASALERVLRLPSVASKR